MDTLARPLNPLLRLAAISGVETAVRLHIRRGDDLDARDGNGATPMILAAARGKKGIVRLLLQAGANPMLVDSNGMNALDHATVAGCSETVALLSEVLTQLSALKCECSGLTQAETTHLGTETIHIAMLGKSTEPTRGPASAVKQHAEGFISSDASDHTIDLPLQILSSGATGTDGSTHADNSLVHQIDGGGISLDDLPLGEAFADEWVAEEETVAPEGDASIGVAAGRVHQLIGRHTAINADENWDDVELHLPERAALLDKDEGDGNVRALFLACLREGMVSEESVIEVCSDADGTRNKEAERLLGIVAGELGATVVKWTGTEGCIADEPSPEESSLLDDAIELARGLGLGQNDPFRLYSKDMRGDLLEADEEIALGREMEAAWYEALQELARWPEGLAMLYEVADRIVRKEADAQSFSAGPEPSADASIDQEDVPENDAWLDEEASAFVSAVLAVRAAEGDCQRVAEALEAARLARGFILTLSERAEGNNDLTGFTEALRRQSAARERMILCNLRLALSIAKKYLWSGLPFDDLVQEANIGLMKAVERYDWRRGFRFSTYATWWIRQQVSRSIADTGRVVRAPVHIQETARKVLRERESEEARLGRPETVSETARRIGMPLAKTRMLLAMFEDAVSLDEVDPDTGLSRAESLIDENTADPSDVAGRASLRRTLLGMLEDFDERAREVILLRFGLADDDPMTLEEVGQHFGVTRERIRQIESKTMRRLSRRNKREILWPFMGDGYAPACEASPDAAKTGTTSGTDDEASPVDEAPVTPKPVVKREVPVFPAPRSKRETSSGVKPIPVRGADRAFPDGEVSMTPASMLADDKTSRIADEARALGLRVEDRRAQGGDLIIVAPYASPPNVRAFGRRLLASGFRKIRRDVFAK